MTLGCRCGMRLSDLGLCPVCDAVLDHEDDESLPDQKRGASVVSNIRTIQGDVMSVELGPAGGVRFQLEGVDLVPLYDDGLAGGGPDVGRPFEIDRRNAELLIEKLQALFPASS